MNFILRITIRYGSSEITTAQSWAFTTYDGDQKKMIEELERLHRQIMATELTDVTGYTVDLKKWISGNNYKRVAWIDYDLAL